MKGVKNLTNKKAINKMIFAALFLALALILPFLGGQIPEINSVFCPMHIPIFLCGFICGWRWGVTVGFVSPLLRSLIFGFPVFYPVAVTMMFELAAYGLITGIMKELLPKKRGYIYCSLIVAMIIGRVCRTVAMIACSAIVGNSFIFSTFMTGVILKSIPGIIAHLIIVPIAIMLIDKAALKYKSKEKASYTESTKTQK